MALQLESFVSGLSTAWQSSTALSALVPGGLWFGKAPETASVPYAIFSVSSSGVIKMASRDIIHNVDISVSVFSSAPMTDSLHEDIRFAINDAWASTTLIPIDIGRVITIDPSSASTDLSDDRRNAEDVLVASAGFSSMVQGVF